MSIEGNPANAEREANDTTAERQFDALLRLTNLVNRADAGILSSFALTLDDADQRTQVIREDGKIYTYSYDAIGQLTNAAATLPDGTPWTGYQFSYSYDATGNPVEQNKNGLVYSNSFNNLNQNAETRFAGGLAALGTYSSPLAATVTVNNVQAQLYDGDWAAAGIPFVQGTNDLVCTIQDLAGRSLCSTSTVVVADRTYAYDANGNMTTNGVFTYVWDCENRLTEVWKNGSLVQSNRYDALWRRREKIEYAPDGTATTNRYIYKDWLVLAITDGSGYLLETYTHGADLSGHVGGSAGGIGGIIAFVRGNENLYCHYDFQGNLSSIVLASQLLLSMYGYFPAGGICCCQGPSIGRFLFSSKEYDISSGLTYFGYRFISSVGLRFLNRDPLGEIEEKNLYCMIGNNAVCKVDFLGMRVCEQDGILDTESIMLKEVKDFLGFMLKGQKAGASTFYAEFTTQWGIDVSAFFDSPCPDDDLDDLEKEVTAYVVVDEFGDLSKPFAAVNLVPIPLNVPVFNSIETGISQVLAALTEGIFGANFASVNTRILESAVRDMLQTKPKEYKNEGKWPTDRIPSFKCCCGNE